MMRNGGECGRLLVFVLTVLTVGAIPSVAELSGVPAPSSELPEAQSAAAPGIPEVMMYEGYLTNAEGEPQPDGLYDFRFSLYEKETGGVPVWTEEHAGVEVIGGVVQVQLGGGTTPVALDLPFDVQYYLGIQLGNDPEMVPRLRLMTTAYAFRAGVAEEVPDLSITAEKLAPLSVTDESIESVSWEKVTGVPEDALDGEPKDNGTPPTPSSVWHTGGNRRTNPERDYVGTSDLTDLIIATDGEERIRVAGDGSNIEILADTLAAKYVLSRVAPGEGAFFLADPRHGLRRTGNDDVHLYTTGGNLLLEGGNVGIGTTAPTAKLHVTSSGYGGQSDINSYPMRLDTGGQGMAIKVDQSLGTLFLCADHNYVSFWDSDGMRGRIEAQCNLDLVTHPRYIYFTLVDYLQLSWASIELIGAISDVRVCAGLGVVTCPPSIPVVAAKSAALALQAARAIGTQVFMYSKMGVAYRSAAGDYAEWLERVDPGEAIEPGDVVGVFGGKVTKGTKGAHQIMVASHAPIVLGNSPPEEREHLYSKIAFMGQVPVKMTGPVNEGDYVIPSGLNDGTAVAVPQELMTFAEYSKIIGRAWGSSVGDYPAMVTVAIGLNQADMAASLGRQQGAVESLRADLTEKENDVLELRAEVSELKEQVRGLDALQQELAAVRDALGVPGVTVPAADATIPETTDGSW